MQSVSTPATIGGCNNGMGSHGIVASSDGILERESSSLSLHPEGDLKIQWQHAADFEAMIDAVKGQSAKLKLMLAKLIPRFGPTFPDLTQKAVSAMFDLVKVDATEVRKNAILGFRQFTHVPGFVSRAADVLARHLDCEDPSERTVVHNVMNHFISRDTESSLESLFKLMKKPEFSEMIIHFLNEEVFPLKGKIFHSDEIKSFITILIKQCVQDVTGSEFDMFLSTLQKLSIFGDSASTEFLQVLVEVIQSQFDLKVHFEVSGIEHIEKWVSCMLSCLPFSKRGTSSMKLLEYFINQIVPVFEEISEEKKPDLLKAIAVASPYVAMQDSHKLLPSVAQLLKKYMPRDEQNIRHDYVECLLYAFHQLAHKTPSIANTLCGYKIVTDEQMHSRRADYSENYKDFTERLARTEKTVHAASKSTQGMPGLSKKISSANTEEESCSKGEQHMSTSTMRCYTNILAMTQPLRVEAPMFFGNQEIVLSFQHKEPAVTATGRKRPQSENFHEINKQRGGNCGMGNRGRGAWHGWR